MFDCLIMIIQRDDRPKKKNYKRRPCGAIDPSRSVVAVSEPRSRGDGNEYKPTRPRNYVLNVNNPDGSGPYQEQQQG